MLDTLLLGQQGTRRLSNVDSLIWEAFIREISLGDPILLLASTSSSQGSGNSRGTIWIGAKKNNYTALEPFTMEPPMGAGILASLKYWPI